jgi:hypothetical protein
MNPKYLEQAKQAALKALLPQGRPGDVVGIGIGKKLVKGKPTPTDCVRAYVLSKLDPGYIWPVGLVPPSFGDVPTDVIEIGRLGRNGRAATANTPPNYIGPGSSIRVKTEAPNVNSGATGTLGMLVSYADQRYILGCNHILSVNGRVQAGPKAEIVSAEFIGNEPTIADPDPRGYVPLTRDSDNRVDCALGRANGNVSAAFPTAFIDPKPYPKDPRPQMRVKKLGAATGTTHGAIADVAVDLDVDYDFGTFHFVNQILVEGDDDNFATAGDSGSIIVDEDSQQPVGMVFAESGKYAVACPLSEVLNRLQSQLQNGKDGKVGLKLVV